MPEYGYQLLCQIEMVVWSSDSFNKMTVSLNFVEIDPPRYIFTINLFLFFSVEVEKSISYLMRKLRFSNLSPEQVIYHLSLISLIFPSPPKS